MSSVMNFMSIMAASTTWARFSAPSGIAARREPRRRANQAGERGCFRHRELRRRLGEIALRRRLDAVGAGAEVDPVEIEIEDLGLAELALQPGRQRHLLHLAGERALLRQEQVLGELLGQRRAALRDAAMQDVGDDGAGDADRIDAVMRVEAPVLDRHECLRHVARQVLQRHRGAAHVAAGGEQVALQIDDLDRGRALGDFERLDRRQMGADPHRAADGGDDQPEADDRAPIGHPSDGPPPAATAATFAAATLALGAAASIGGFGAAGRRAASAPESDAERPVKHGFAAFIGFRRCHIRPANPPGGPHRQCVGPGSRAGYGGRFKGRLSCRR